MKNGLLMGMMVVGLAATASLASLSSRASGVGITPAPKAEHCTAAVSTYNYRRSDTEFSRVAARLNREFSRNVDLTKSVNVAKERRPVVPAEAETIRIQVDTVSCATGQGPSHTTASLGGCNYAGCIGDLGPDYANLPVGSTISISVCANRIQTVANYQRQGDGNWLMVGYRQEMVVSCNLQPLG